MPNLIKFFLLFKYLSTERYDLKIFYNVRLEVVRNWYTEKKTSKIFYIIYVDVTLAYFIVVASSKGIYKDL